MGHTAPDETLVQPVEKQHKQDPKNSEAFVVGHYSEESEIEPESDQNDRCNRNAQQKEEPCSEPEVIGTVPTFPIGYDPGHDALGKPGRQLISRVFLQDAEHLLIGFHIDVFDVRLLTFLNRVLQLFFVRIHNSSSLPRYNFTFSFNKFRARKR